MKFLIIVLPLFSMLTGCASTSRCPSVDEKAVSICRARVACHEWQQTDLNIVVPGTGSDSSGNNALIQTYDACIENNLSAQSANAKAQLPKHGCLYRTPAYDEVVNTCQGN